MGMLCSGCNISIVLVWDIYTRHFKKRSASEPRRMQNCHPISMDGGGEISKTGNIGKVMMLVFTTYSCIWITVGEKESRPEKKQNMEVLPSAVRLVFGSAIRLPPFHSKRRLTDKQSCLAVTLAWCSAVPPRDGIKKASALCDIATVLK